MNLEERYELYPIPQNILYMGKTLRLEDEISLNADFDLSPNLKRTIVDIFEKKNISFVKDAGFELKIYNLRQKNNSQTGIIKTDCYDLKLDEDITITGKNEDAIFYALKTLEQIFNQSDRDLHRLEIFDYSDCLFRGVVEGYYGIPWSNQDRKSIMEFGSKFKMNTFVFAPKDDPYHRQLWWELYPEDEIEEISDLAKYGESIYNHYVWTIAPFWKNTKSINEENKEEGLEKIIRKFDQLYQAGVRQFGVLGDDVGNLPYDTVVYIMNELNKWRKEKEDVRELLFCPEGYNMEDWAFKDGSELNKYDREFDPDIHIFYTGERVCSPVSQRAIDRFKYERTNGKRRRNPLFWLNWPVNDIDRKEYRRLFLGQAELIEAGYKNLAGILTNPMQEAEASKVAIFSVLNAAWNSYSFDCEKSWADGFKYIDEDAGQYLFEISKHMSNIKNGALDPALESENLNSKVHRFANDFTLYKRDKISSEDLFVSLADLINEYKVIVNSVNKFHELSKNDKLKKEIYPYSQVLKLKAEAAIILLQALKERILREDRGPSKLLDKAQEKLNQAKDYKVHTKTAEFPNTELRAEAGMIVIDENIKNILEILD